MAGGTTQESHGLTNILTLHTSLTGDFQFEHIYSNKGNTSLTNKILVPPALGIQYDYLDKASKIRPIIAIASVLC